MLGLQVHTATSSFIYGLNFTVILWGGPNRTITHSYPEVVTGLFTEAGSLNLSVWLGLASASSALTVGKMIPHERAFVNAWLLGLFYLA